MLAGLRTGRRPPGVTSCDSSLIFTFSLILYCITSYYIILAQDRETAASGGSKLRQLTYFYFFTYIILYYIILHHIGSGPGDGGLRGVQAAPAHLFLLFHLYYII